MSARSLSVVLIVLLFGAVVAGVPAGVRGAAPGAPSPTESASCTLSDNPSFAIQATWNSTQGWVGPAPLNVTFAITLNGSVGEYNYTVLFGDLTQVLGTVDQANATGSTTLDLTHRYALPGNYTINTTAYWQCSPGNYLEVTSGAGLAIYGPAGPDPLHVAGTQSSGYVTGNVTYTAAVSGRPSNSTIQWAVQYPGDTSYAWIDNQTELNITPRGPGLVGGTVYVVYPNGILYASAELPELSFAAASNVSAAAAPVPPGSPASTTLWANVTPAAGAPSVPGATVQWGFPWGPVPGLSVSGNLSGSPIHPTFYYNSSSPANLAFNFQATSVATVPDAAGGAPVPVVLGSALLDLSVSNTSGGSAAPILGLDLVNTSFWLANQSQGGLHFDVDASVGSASGNVPSGGPWSLTIDVYAACCTGDVAAWASSPGWNGTPTVVPLSVPAWGPNQTVSGNLTVIGTLFAPGANSTQVPVTSSNITVVPPGNLSVRSLRGPTPLNVALTTSPANGTAPVRFLLDVSADGGSAPYNLSVCLQGPSPSAPASGPCTSVGSRTGWNGSGLSFGLTLNASGTYAATATVNDSNGSSTAAVATMVVAAAGMVPVLQAVASVVPPSSGSGGTYGFVTQVSGGVAPYDIQWAFGDGTSGSALPGATVRHTYTTAGEYVATLTVMDAKGTVVVTKVGPFEVTLAAGGTGPASPLGISAGTAALLAGGAVVVLASLVALVLVSRWVAHRREALNWLHDLEQRRGPGGPPTQP